MYLYVLVFTALVTADQPVSCGRYRGKPEACRKVGCTYVHLLRRKVGSCIDLSTAQAPAACDSLKRKSECQAGGCKWKASSCWDKGHTLQCGDYAKKGLCRKAKCWWQSGACVEDCPNISQNGRCGPLFGDAVCSTKYRNYALYCNTANGWCGNTTSHRDAQAGTLYDNSSIPDHCYKSTESATWLESINGAHYLNLPETDNWSEYHPVRTTWSKLQLTTEPKCGDTSVTVDLGNFEFSKSTGEPSNGHKLGQVEWGIAMDCRFRGEHEPRKSTKKKSSYSLNLAGTPFRVKADQDLSPKGWLPYGSAGCRANGKRCRGTCGGNCGFCGFGHAGVAMAEEINPSMFVSTVTLMVDDQAAFDAAFGEDCQPDSIDEIIHTAP